MAVLILKDDLDTVDLNNGSDFKYIDDTLDLAMPTKKETRFESQAQGRDLLSMSYNNRTITLEFYAIGATDAVVRANISKVSRMLIRASQGVYLSGGAYQQSITLAEGANTGDQGLILRYQVTSATEGSIEKEDGTTVTGSNTLTFRIIAGELTVLDALASARSISVSGGKRFRHCKLVLEAEPFALGEARILSETTGNGFYAYPISPDGSNINRVFIDAASIPGDVPAMTRIYTQLNTALGIIIGRDAGISLLNSSSAPVFSGSGINDMFTYGIRRNTSGITFVVKITSTGTPNQFQYSQNGGAFSSSVNIVAKTPTQLGSTGIYVFFYTSTGHTLNNTWTFNDNQAYMVNSASAIDIYANRSSCYSATGVSVGTIDFTVPPGCRGKYKVYASFTAGGTGGVSTYEVGMALRFVGYDGSTRVDTQDMSYDWISARGGLVDMGIIDLTPRVTPHMLHPNGFTQGRLVFKFRTDGTITSTATFNVSRFFFVPCQDEYSYMHALWVYDGAGREVYSNFDPSNPYIAEVAGNQFDSAFPDVVNIVPLDHTYSGNVITLIPGVDNTLIFIPLRTDVLGSADWRHSSISTSSKTQSTSIAIRPRYLYGG